MTRPLARLAAMLLIAGLVSPAGAADAPPPDRHTRLIELLIAQGVITRGQGEALLKEVDAPATAPAAAAAPPVRVPYVPAFVREEIKAEVRRDLRAEAEREGWAGPGTVPDWVRRIRFDGDVRLRLQRDDFAEGNAIGLRNVLATNAAGAERSANSTVDRQRLRVRARFGLGADLDENWSVALRLATGSATDPLSENQTLGTTGARLPVAFDRAYLRYRNGSDFNVVAGRIGNPWFGTDLLWANDLGFDGVAAQWTPQVSGDLRGFVTLGALPIEEVELSTRDKWLLGAQVGAEAARLFGGSASGKVGLGLYRYTHIVGQKDPANGGLQKFTAPGFAQKGNTYYNIFSDQFAGVTPPVLYGLASDYRLLNLTASLDLPLAPGLHLLPTLDLVRNQGFDRAAVAARVGFDVVPRTRGHLLRFALGSPSVAQAGDWQVSIGHKRVERDAVLDAFTDSDFRLGGTDAKGFVLGGSVGIGRNTAFNARVLSAKAIDGPPLDINVIQFDLNLRF
jgi:hypothetical protein